MANYNFNDYYYSKQIDVYIENYKIKGLFGPKRAEYVVRVRYQQDMDINVTVLDDVGNCIFHRRLNVPAKKFVYVNVDIPNAPKNFETLIYPTFNTEDIDNSPLIHNGRVDIMKFDMGKSVKYSHYEEDAKTYYMNSRRPM